MDKPRKEGLYPDPEGSGMQRYFDGEEWTDVLMPYQHRSIGVLGVAGGVILAVLVLAWIFGAFG